jgi:tripartite-type tricarboxylate transporter receptor subunit TctC
LLSLCHRLLHMPCSSRAVKWPRQPERPLCMCDIRPFVAPPGTPLMVRQRLNEAVASALASAEVEQALSRLGVQARPVSPDEFASYLAREQQHWGRIKETTRVSVD